MTAPDRRAVFLVNPASANGATGERWPELERQAQAPLALPLSAAPPIGVLTALIGAPFLVVIARKAAP